MRKAFDGERGGRLSFAYSHRSNNIIRSPISFSISRERHFQILLPRQLVLRKSISMADSKKKIKSNTNSSNRAGSNNANENISLTDQLNRAHAAVECSQQAALQLHHQWRNHLLRLSYLVIIVTFHQCQAPTITCIKEIKVRPTVNKKKSMLEGPSGIISRYPSFFACCFCFLSFFPFSL